jgi:hypothetical protein
MLLADLLEAHARYTRLLLAALAEPARFDATALARARSAGRLLRSNTEAAIDRLVGEPAGVQPIDPRVALGVLAALRRGALAALALIGARGRAAAHASLAGRARRGRGARPHGVRGGDAQRHGASAACVST